jgi:hypothetical protein
LKKEAIWFVLVAYYLENVTMTVNDGILKCKFLMAIL